MGAARSVLIRADAGVAMGTGHVMRCLAIAETLAEAGVDSILASAGLPPALEQRAVATGLRVVALPVPFEPGRDVAATRTLLADCGASAAIVDGYHFDPAWRAALRAAGRPVLAFDDTGIGGLHADIVVNAAPDVAAIPYDRLAPGARLLLGPAHAPLRREFRLARRAGLPPLSARHRLLLAFGGSDPLGLTAPCVERLVGEFPAGCRLAVAVGGSNPRLEEIREAADRAGDRVDLHIDSRDMARLMSGSGLAVASAGTTSAELAAMGVPSLLVVVADNQAMAASQSAALAWAEAIDGRDGAVLDRIAARAVALWSDGYRRERMAALAEGLVDAEGATRIAAALLAVL